MVQNGVIVVVSEFYLARTRKYFPAQQIIQCFLFSIQEAVHVLFLREKMLISTCTEHRSENQDFRQQMAAKLLLFLVIDSVHHFADMCT